ncbi:hypothetical protein CNMCM8060_002419 [Aspergillus lentulus]|nr:hypothetical protein CNMCM8060_002419 [Aspergillus lentulus]
MRSRLGLILGRVLIELGGVVIGVLASEIITRWFKYAASLMVITCWSVLSLSILSVRLLRDKQLSLALALNLGVSRLGSVAASTLIPNMIGSSNVVSATWMGTLLLLGAIAISVSTLLAFTNALSGQTTAPDTGSAAPLRQLPRIYGHRSLICVLGYGGINTFTNSTQRFLASRFYHANQRTAGLATR